MSKALQAYKSVDVNAAVLGATPFQLVAMMYEGAIHAISRAILAIELKNYALKSSMITKAVSIVSVLRVSFDYENGGELVSRMQDLHLYIEKRLMDANLQNDTEVLSECKNLLAELHSAWDELVKKGYSTP